MLGSKTARFATLGCVAWSALVAQACGTTDRNSGTLVPPFTDAPQESETDPNDGASQEQPPPSDSETPTPGNDRGEGLTEPIGIDRGDESSTNGPPDPADVGEQAPDAPRGSGFSIMENLDRGVVAVPKDGGAFISWRMFGDEYRRDEPERIAYQLLRDGVAIATVTDSTNFQDPAGTLQSSYSVAAIVDGRVGAPSAPVTPWAEGFLRIPLSPPGNGYTAHDASLGDLDGDGRYEVVMLWQPNNAKDNSQAGVTDDVFIDALTLEGTQLWRINLGPNIRAGEHYTQFVVIDADGDGRAEVGVKTAPGTRDGTGAFLGLGPAADDDDSASFVANDGYVLAGPEYFTVFDGQTGGELAASSPASWT
jgi:hypothetical protein